MDVRGKLREFMLQEFKESGFHESIRDDESLIESSILDSLSILKLISFMDDQFGVLPAEDELNPEKLETIDKIVEFIANKIE